MNHTPEPNSFSRRKFIASGLLAGAYAALPKSALAADASSSSEPTPKAGGARGLHDPHWHRARRTCGRWNSFDHYIPAHGMRRVTFTPAPAGFRFYHTHLIAGSDLNRGQYNGQVGPVYIEPKNEPGNYDREVFLVLTNYLTGRQRAENGRIFLQYTQGQAEVGTHSSASIIQF
jgi:hypothetical protein